MQLRRIALFSGPLLFLLLVLLPAPAGMSHAAQLTAGITLWIAIWWITEPVHSAVTSLLPLALFPFSGVTPLKAITPEYGNEIIFLFISGFFIGKTIEKWNLHKRIALTMVLALGTNPARMVLGFMVATGVISMWISNTATAVMMTPVAIAVGQHVAAGEKGRNFRIALLLGVGYACSIGGLGTMIGTPTNAIFISYAEAKLGETVSFGKWLLLGVPFVAILLLICWQMLVRMFPLPASLGDHGHSRETVEQELARLGPLSAPEKRLLLAFGTVVLAWITGSLFWYKWVPNCNDTAVAVSGALLMFLIPAGVNRPAHQTEPDDEEAKLPGGEPLLDWATAVTIPWGIVLLFGGGLALAKAFDTSGLAVWIGEQLRGLSAMPHALILLAVLLVVVALSEVASNVATASMMMPVLAALAASIGTNPFGLCLSATLAASFGFALPVATAANSIVYASGFMSTKDMARAGFLLDLLSVLLLLAFIYILVPIVWGFSV